MDQLASKLGIKEPKQWSSVTVRTVCSHGGISLLNHFNFSLVKALQEIYQGS